MGQPIMSCHPLGDTISELAAQLNAATCQLLELIARFDCERGWAHDGCRSCAHWLNWKCGIGDVAAREKVRVAAALAGVPKVHKAFAAGELSYSKVRAITRVATPESEDYLLMIARHGTAAHLETTVRGYRRVQRQRELAEANTAYAARALRWHHDENAMMTFTLTLPAEEGQRLAQAVTERQRTLMEERDDACDSAETSFNARRADALMDLITAARDTEVVVHVSAETLVDDAAEGDCHLAEGPALPPESARRLACDAGIVRLVEGPDGQPLDIGRRTRSIPPALKRALKARDGGCRFPGCASTRGVEGHHIIHWADGGRTAIDNLVQLCHHHHRQIHEGGFGVTFTTGQGLRFYRPNGSVIESTPPVHVLRGDAVDSLRDRNLERGANIDFATGTPFWDGTVIDEALAVEGLLSAHGELAHVPVRRRRPQVNSS